VSEQQAEPTSSGDPPIRQRRAGGSHSSDAANQPAAAQEARSRGRGRIPDLVPGQGDAAKVDAPKAELKEQGRKRLELNGLDAPQGRTRRARARAGS
jgi:hypothetical protein